MPAVQQGFIPKCQLCHKIIPMEELILELHDPALGPGQLHRDCRNQLVYAAAHLHNADLGPCEEPSVR